MDEEAFQRLKEEWKQDTAFISSPVEIAMHWAYRQIIEAGEEAVPYIIEDLREGPGHWFWALQEITGENPIPKDHQGHMKKMAQDWIEWYERQQ